MSLVFGMRTYLYLSCLYFLMTIIWFTSKKMVVGTQYTDFIRKVRQQAEEDFCLCCILYLLTDSAEEEKQLYDRIRGRAYADIQEMIFAAYVFQGRRDAWEIIKKHGEAFLGKERDYHAYENIQLYAWVLKQFQREIRKYRGRGISVLRSHKTSG